MKTWTRTVLLGAALLAGCEGSIGSGKTSSGTGASSGSGTAATSGSGTGNTIGTRVFTWRKGERVGEDGLGNVYYQERDGARRWVIYRMLAEPSQIPPEWHAWLHHTVDVPPTRESYSPHPWEKPHRPNMTGSYEAYRPPGFNT